MPILGEKSSARKISHIQLCQFHDDEDEALNLVCSSIIEIVNDFARGSLLGIPRFPTSDCLINGSLAEGVKEYINCRRLFCSFFPDVSPRKVILPQTGTLEWLSANLNYKSWHDSRAPAILYIFGQPGSGKSVISNFLIKTLQQSEPAEESADAELPAEGLGKEKLPTVITYYFDKLDARRRSCRHLLLSLVRQLLFRGHSMYKHVESLYRKIEQQHPWTEEDLWVTFRSMITCEGKARVICVIDSLDECASGKAQVIEGFKRLQANTDVPFKLVLLSQHNEGTSELDSSVDLDQEHLLKSDRNRVTTRWLQGLQNLRPKAVDSIADKFSNLDISFLENSLVFSCIEDSMYAELLSELEERYQLLARPSPRLQQIYERILAYFGSRELLQCSEGLHLITCSKYPLAAQQLALAVGILKPGRKQADEDLQAISKLKQILSARPILRFSGDEVRFIHCSARDFLANWGRGNPDPIAVVCLKHLCMPKFEEVVSFLEYRNNEPKLVFRHVTEEECAFLLYATQYWPMHYREAPEELGSGFPVLQQFLRSKSRVKWWYELYQFLQRPWNLSLPQKLSEVACDSYSKIVSTSDDICCSSVLNIASIFGLVSVVPDLFPCSSINERRISLKLAIENGWESVTQVIAEKWPGDITSIFEDSQALGIACKRGHESVVQVLLSMKDPIPGQYDFEHRPIDVPQNDEPDYEAQGIRHDRSTRISSTTNRCLCIAAEAGHMRIVGKLISAGGDIAFTDEEDHTPLILAAKGGYEQTVAELLKSRPDLEAADRTGYTAFH